MTEYQKEIAKLEKLKSDPEVSNNKKLKYLVNTLIENCNKLEALQEKTKNVKKPNAIIDGIIVVFIVGVVFYFLGKLISS